MNAGGGAGGFIATRDEERYARQYPTLNLSIAEHDRPGECGFTMTLFHQTSYGSREEGNDWTGNSVYLWAVANAVYMALMGPEGFAELGRRSCGAATTRRAGWRRSTACGRWPAGFFKEFVVGFDGTGKTVAEINAACASAGSSAATTSRATSPSSGRAPSTASPRCTRRPTSTGLPTRSRR